MSRRSTCIVATALALLALGGDGRLALAAGEIKMRYLYASYGFSSSQPFSRPSGLFYHVKRSELYVADTGNGQIVVLDKNGNSAARIPHEVVNAKTGLRSRGEPRSVAVRDNGDILVVDNLCNYLDVLDFRGRSVQKVWPSDLVGQPKTKVTPRCVTIDPAGNVYLGVGGFNSEILVLTPDLRLKTQMGVEAGGESKSLTGLWVNSEGRVYATYAAGVCVRVYAPDGSPLAAFGTHDAGPNNFSLPVSLATDGLGRVWAVDALRHVVSVFDMAPSSRGLNSAFLSLAIGGRGEDAGNLSFPSAIASDGATRIFVAESTGARVQAFETLPAPVPAAAN